MTNSDRFSYHMNGDKSSRKPLMETSISLPSSFILRLMFTILRFLHPSVFIIPVRERTAELAAVVISLRKSKVASATDLSKISLNSDTVVSFPHEAELSDSSTDKMPNTTISRGWIRHHHYLMLYLIMQA